MASGEQVVGKRFGSYQIVDELGKGGMGVVYRARDVTLDRMAAVKFLPPEISSVEDAVKRFVREARAAARLNHPNIVTIYQVGLQDDVYFIAMEYVEGAPLDALIRKTGKMDPLKAAGLIKQVAEALAEAHGEGIIHRDIKPANIMVTKSGRAKVMDFGLARATHENTQLTSAGSTMGTPQYMAPEQWMDSKVDGRADIFSLGVTLYAMVTGTSPFDGSSAPAVMQKVLQIEPPNPTTLNEAVSPQLADILEKMLAKKASDRFQSAGDLAAALDGYLQSGSGGVPSAAGFSAPGSEFTLEKLEKSDAQFRTASSGSREAGPPQPPQAAPEAEEREGSKVPLIAGIAVIALLVLATGGWLVLGGGGPYSDLFPESDFVAIYPGSFQMGSPPSESGRSEDETLHEVTLTETYYLSKYEVTQKQWTAVMGFNPSHFIGEDLPVENVSWEDVQTFLGKVNEAQGTRYRLPTEAEWEYAARAGSISAYSFGDSPVQLADFAWYARNSGQRSHPVGQKRPNAWGLHDMSGNVWEWCQDWAGAYPPGASTNPLGPPSGAVRIGRGGSWGVPETNCRVADRSGSDPNGKGPDLGFRICHD